MSESSDATAGRRVVLVVYVAVLLVSAVLGLIIGVARPVSLDPVLFGVVELPPTPLGMVVYGVVTVGVLLGAVLVLIEVVSERFDVDRVE